MVSQSYSKTIALVISVTVIVLSFFSFDLKSLGIYNGCEIYSRAFYSFFHASFFHALANAWCLLSLVFIYDVSVGKLILSYLIAVSFPVNTIFIISDSLQVPTVGLSALCFALIGLLTFSVKRKMFFMTWALVTIVVGFLIPGINGIIHLYCYLIGVAVALLNMPIYEKEN